MVYYKDNLPANQEFLPIDGLLSLVPYQKDLDFGSSTIRMDTTGEVFTSGRSDFVAARFVGYAVFDAGSYSVCLDSDNEGKLYIDGNLSIAVSQYDLGRECGTVEYTAEPGVKRVEVEFTEGGGLAKCIVEWKPPGSSAYNDLPFITSKVDDEIIP